MADTSTFHSPPVMTIAEVAEYLRIPRASVYKLAQQRRIPCQKVGRHWRFRRETVDKWLDSAPSPVDGHVERVPEAKTRMGGQWP